MQIEIQFDLNPGQAWGREGVIFHRGVPASGRSLVTPHSYPTPTQMRHWDSLCTSFIPLYALAPTLLLRTLVFCRQKHSEISLQFINCWQTTVCNLPMEVMERS